ncbi:MAG: methyltransferase domain-containing protein [Bryobacteraceae bacterium]|nr:methyltransferase domain-containing protein [Bryobacteraceae bacterium]
MSNYDLALLGYRLDGMPQTIATRTRRVYDRVAAFYPISTHLFHSRAHRAALRDSGIRDGMRVLEVATGSGEMFRRLVRVNRSGTTLGFDLSPNMAARTLRRVRKEYPKSAAHCNAVDARFMPFPDASFDAVVCCYLLELLSAEDIVRTVGELHRVLRPRATLTLILIDQNLRAFNRIYRFCGRMAPAFWGRQVAGRARDVILASDFQIVSERCVRQTGYPSRVLVARK